MSFYIVFPFDFFRFHLSRELREGLCFQRSRCDILSSANKRGPPLTILLISTLINSSGAPTKLCSFATLTYTKSWPGIPFHGCGDTAYRIAWRFLVAA